MDYTLRYLPIAKQDLADAINFILNEYQKLYCLVCSD